MSDLTPAAIAQNSFKLDETFVYVLLFFFVCFAMIKLVERIEAWKERKEQEKRKKLESK